MRRAALWGAVALAIVQRPVLAEPESQALLEGGTLIVRRVPKRVPLPAAPSAPPVMLTPGGPVPGFGWWNDVPAGEVVMQQGGFAYGLGQPTEHSVGTSAVAVAMHGFQNDMAWSYKSSIDRQNAQWLLGEFNLAGKFKGDSRLAVGDDLASAGPLLMESVQVRGVHAALSPALGATRFFFGEDRPVLNSVIRPRLMSGLASEWTLGGIPLRTRGVYQEAFDGQRGSAALSLGSGLEFEGTRLDGEVAASANAGPIDMAWNVEARAPIGRSSLTASYVHMGPHFQTVRNIHLPQEGGRESWGANWMMPLPRHFRATGQFLDLQSNLGGQPDLPRQTQRMAVAGLSYEPESGPSAAMSYGRTAFRSRTAQFDFESTYHRLSTEVRAKLPIAGQTRTYWEWWNNELPSGATHSAHQLGLQTIRLLDSPFALTEALTLNALGPARLTHTLGWDGNWHNGRVQGNVRAFFDHPVTAPNDPGSQMSLQASLSLPVTKQDSLNLVGQSDRRLDGLYTSARWSLNYVTRFGGGPRSAQSPRLGRITGQVRLSGTAEPLDTASLSVVLDHVQRVAVDAHGRFAFENLSPGPHTVQLDTSRMPIAFTIPRSQLNRVVTVVPGQAAAAMSFEVGPSHQVSGRVTLPDGRGVGFVGVALEGAEPMETWTDDDGRFVFEAVPAGVARVRLASAPPNVDIPSKSAEAAIELAAGKPTPLLPFTVTERPRLVEKVTLSNDLESFIAAPASPPPPAATVARAAGGYALTLPAPPDARRVWVRLGTGPWQAMARQGNGHWRLVLKRLPGAGAAEVRWDVGGRMDVVPLRLTLPAALPR